MSRSMPRLALMFSTASLRTVRFRRPRKSIFSEPMYSQSGPLNPVIRAPSSGRRWIGITSTSGSDDKITPAACTPVPRIRPSMPAGGVDDLLDVGVLVVQLAQFGGLGVAGVLLVEDRGERDLLALTAGGNALVIFSPTANG